MVFGLNRQGIEPRSIVSVAEALSIRPLIGMKNVDNITVNAYEKCG